MSLGYDTFKNNLRPKYNLKIGDSVRVLIHLHILCKKKTTGLLYKI